MSRTFFNPETGRSHRRLNMCFACVHGFHLSCMHEDCTCRPNHTASNHSSQQSASMPHAASEVQLRSQLAGEAIAS